MRSWKMQTAKARLSELVKRTAEGPQQITAYGRSVAVVLSQAQFETLHGRQSLVDFMQSSPLAGHDEMQLERDKSTARNVTFELPARHQRVG